MWGLLHLGILRMADDHNSETLQRYDLCILYWITQCLSRAIEIGQSQLSLKGDVL
jgi:hypothetical protein